MHKTKIYKYETKAFNCSKMVVILKVSVSSEAEIDNQFHKIIQPGQGCYISLIRISVSCGTWWFSTREKLLKQKIDMRIFSQF